MAEGAFISKGVGIYMQMQGNRMQMQAEQRQLAATAAEMRRQAQETKERFKMNKGFMKREGRSFIQQQAASFASSGIQAGGLTLLQMEEGFRATQEAINVEKFETESQVTALMEGARVAEQAARDAKKAGRFQQVGTILSAFG